MVSLSRPRLVRASLRGMAAKKTTPEADKPEPKRKSPSGTQYTHAEREAQGRTRIEAWFDNEDVVLLDQIAVAHGLKARKAALVLAIQTAAPLLTKKR